MMGIKNIKSVSLLTLSVLAVVSFFAFYSNKTKPSDYVKYVANVKNGLHLQKQVGDWEFDVQYKPYAYIVANELRTNDLKEQVFDEKVKELDGLYHFNLKIGTVSHEDVSTYQSTNQNDQYQRLYYFSYQMKDHIQLIDGQDTLACVAYHFERTYDLSHQKSFVLSFEKRKDAKGDKTLVIDSPLFATGPVKLIFTEENINKIPQIKLSR